MKKILVLLLSFAVSGCGSFPVATPAFAPTPTPTIANSPSITGTITPAPHGCENPDLSPALKANCGRHHYVVSNIVNPSGDQNCGLKDTDGWGGIDIKWLNEWTLPLGGDAYALFRGERLAAGCYSAVITYSESGFESVFNSSDCTVGCSFTAELDDSP
jgi:hypothetical protein